ncbi:MAG: TRAP transporter small permease [Oscillibacter sp.]|nr:TRAP transporter small permease [Oscillibacter sp.]
MKVFKKIMDGLAGIEKVVLVISMTVVTLITFANVVSRYVFHASLSWSEELVINLFILMIMLGCALCARDGTLISLSLVFDRLKVKGKKIFVTIITAFNTAFWVILLKTDMDKALNEIKLGKQTTSLRWPQWIFTSFLAIGALFLIVHTIEYFLDVMRGNADCIKDAQQKEEEGNN